MYIYIHICIYTYIYIYIFPLLLTPHPALTLANWNHKGTKSEPKGDQNASKTQDRIKARV